MNRTRFSFLLVLTVVVALGAAQPAQAGILDSIKGFFGKASDTVKGWFSGGGEKEFTDLLDKVEQSQASVAERQNGILDNYSRRGKDGVNFQDYDVQTDLNGLSGVTGTNEQLYQKLLTVRQELVDNKKDVSKYDERLKRVQDTQRSLEEGYQAIQNFNREGGAFTPPSQVAAGGSAGGDIWNDPAAQGYIDEWLAACGLDGYARFTGAPGLSAADMPDLEGKSRYQWVWEIMADETSGSNISLRDYVTSRLNGQSPAVTPPAAVATGPTPVTGPVSSGSSSGAVIDAGRASATFDSGSEDLGSVEASLKAALKSYTELMSANKLDEAQQVHETIQLLQARRSALISQGTSAR